MDILSLNDAVLTIFGQNLLKERKAKKLSQRGLEEICGIDHSDISKMENGGMNVTLNTVVQLANALEIPYYNLLKPVPPAKDK